MSNPDHVLFSVQLMSWHWKHTHLVSNFYGSLSLKKSFYFTCISQQATLDSRFICKVSQLTTPTKTHHHPYTDTSPPLHRHITTPTHHHPYTSPPLHITTPTQTHHHPYTDTSPSLRRHITTPFLMSNTWQ